MRKALHRVPWLMIALVVSWTIAGLILTAGLFAASPQLERATLLSEPVRSASPLSTDQALAEHAQVRSYLLGFAETIDGATPAEISHLRDVRRLSQTMLGIALLLIVVGIGVIRKLPDTSYRLIARRVSIGIIATIAVLGGIALASGFSEFFLTFHLLFFPEGNFTFAANSFLIELYPEAFFGQMAAAIAALTLVVAAVAYVLARERHA